MEETRIDRLEQRLDELASAMRAGFRAYRMNGAMKNWMAATALALPATFLVALFGLRHRNG